MKRLQAGRRLSIACPVLNRLRPNTPTLEVHRWNTPHADQSLSALMARNMQYGGRFGRLTRPSAGTHNRLVHVIDGRSRDRDTDYAYARHVLHGAWVAVEATGEPVKLQSDIKEGDRSRRPVRRDLSRPPK